MSILVLIASYRDPELGATIKDAIKQASDPCQLSFGICWQGSDAEWETITQELAGIPNCSLLRYSYVESKGACWARALTQRLWKGETYIYQIDAHCRFAHAWDQQLIRMLALCKATKPLLSCYPASYDPLTGKLQEEAVGVYMGASGFNDYGVLTISTPGNIKADHPVPGFLLSGSAIFTLGKWCLEVPYPPLYFNGEEPLLSVQSYCAGYDIFYPHKQTLYHNYSREHAVRHWTDNLNIQRELDSYAKYRQLLGMEPQDFTLLAGYSLKTERSLIDYQNFTGINFASKTITESAKQGIPHSLKAPMPQSNSPKKVGAFIPAHNSPYFLRAAVLQVMSQTVRPDVLVIHQNNQDTDYLWAIGDLLPECQQRGIFVHNLYTPKTSIQEWDTLGLEYLVNQNCDYFFKLDHDDIYRTNHFELMISHLDQAYELVGNRIAGLLTLKSGAPYTYNANCDFAEFNPIDFMASSIAFTRKLAIAILQAVKDLGEAPLVIDLLIKEKILPFLDTAKILRLESTNPSSIYVAYGGNVSTAHWVEKEHKLITH